MIKPKPPDEYSLLEHLDELRERLFKMIVSLVVGTCVAYIFIDEILFFLIKPVGELVFTAPADAFIARIMLSIFIGFFIAFPVILHQIWAFVGEGLEAQERKYITIFGPLSLLLFVLGSCFAYFLTVPLAVKFLLAFSTENIRPMITIKSYIGFVGTFILAFGTVFELPLVLMFLTKIGIATPEFLRQKRKYAIVIIMVLSALITPPDCITQLMLAIPLIILYEIGLFCVQFVNREKS